MESEPTVDLIRAQLRRMRIAAGLSQEEFGKRVHYSGSQVSAVELGQRPLDRPDVVAVRDSKDPAGPVLAFDPRAWRSFVEFAKRP